jgi:hypothetical protein
MPEAPIEEMLDLWSAELRAVKARLRALLAHPGVAAPTSAFLDGLLGPEWHGPARPDAGLLGT